MDSLTHIYFADKLLQITGGDVAARICSLFPQIDREPAYMHRMFAHPFSKMRQVSEIGIQVYRSEDISNPHAEDFVYSRFYKEKPRMRAFSQLYESETGRTTDNFHPPFLDVLIGYASHTYQDVFNNPMQAFLPQAVYPCGKWALWSELHGIDFRSILYAPQNIVRFRAEFFAHPIWSTHLSPGALLRSMVHRTALASVVPVPQEIEQQAFNSFGIEIDFEGNDVKLADEFLVEHEHILSQLIRKYSSGSELNPENFQTDVVSS